VIDDSYLNEARAPVIAPVHQLPSPPEDFTGRERELETLRMAIFRGGAIISARGGQAGIGKTALALTLAAEMESQFPDAQIYLNLLGSSERPLKPVEAMAYILRAFEPEAALPWEGQELVEIYQSVLAGKRVLLLLDNAQDLQQVEALVPPPGCGLLLTSRGKFALPGLHSLEVSVMSATEAQELLLKIEPAIGAEAAAIADLCGCIPQALGLAAAALGERGDMAPADYRQRLENERRQPKLMGSGNESVEAALSLSYSLLDSGAQKRWRMLFVFRENFDAAAAAAIWNIGESTAEDALDLLTQYAMLAWNDNAHRYHLHGLMHDFACQRIRPEEWNEASLRHAQHYLEVLRRADDLYLDGGGSAELGLVLFDLERGNIEAGQSWSSQHGSGDQQAALLANSYPTVGAHCLGLRQYPQDRLRWREDALAAAILLNDRGAERAHLGNLGAIDLNMGEYRRAIEHYERHRLIARELGDRSGEAQDLENLGNAYEFLGEHARAIALFEQQFQIARELDDRRRGGNALSSLGTAYHGLGDYRSAIDHHQMALNVYRDILDRRGEGLALGNLGIAHYRLGEYQRAIAFYEEQLQIARSTSDRHSEGNALWNMSLALDELGDRKNAIAFAEGALAIREPIKDPHAAKVRRQLEEWQKQSGDE